MSSKRPAAWGVVLAGGYPWDAAAIDHVLPRALLPFGGSSLVEHVLRWLRAGGVAGATVCTNSRSRRVRRVLGDGGALGLPLFYFEDRTPRGPAGCVRDAGLRTGAEAIVVSEASILPRFELSDLLHRHRASGAALTVVAEVDDADPGPLAGWVESSDNGNGSRRYVPTGIYVFSNDAAARVPERGYQDIKEVLIPQLHRAGLGVALYASPRRCPRIVDADSYLALHEWLLEDSAADDWRHCAHQHESWVHPTARVDPAARLIGPVVVGPRAIVGRDALVVGPTSVGARCVIEPEAVVARSVLWERSRIGRGAIVDRSIIASDAAVPAAARFMGRICTGTWPHSLWRRLRGQRGAPTAGELPPPAGVAPAAAAPREALDDPIVSTLR